MLDEGKDLVVLQRRLAARTQDAVRVAVRSAVRDAMRDAARRSRGRRHPGGRAGRRTARRDGVGGAASAAAAAPAAPGVRRPDPRTGRTGGPASGGAAARPSLPGGRAHRPDHLARRSARRPPARRRRDDRRRRRRPRVPGPRRGAGSARRADRRPARRWPTPPARPPSTAAGVRRLLLAETALATARVTTRWSGTQALTLAASPYRTTEALVADVQLAAVDALAAATRPVRDEAAYRALRDAVRPRLEDTVHRVSPTWSRCSVLPASSTPRSASGPASRCSTPLQDVREQLADLVHDGFVSETGAARLPHLARYLRAARHRLAKAAENPHRDAELAWRIHDLEALADATRARVAAGTPDPARTAALTDVRWMLAGAARQPVRPAARHAGPRVGEARPDCARGGLTAPGQPVTSSASSPVQSRAVPGEPPSNAEALSSVGTGTWTWTGTGPARRSRHRTPRMSPARRGAPASSRCACRGARRGRHRRRPPPPPGAGRRRAGRRGAAAP